MPAVPLILLQARAGEVALPLSAVHRVVEVQPNELSPIPRAPAGVLGVTNHWGRIVTVVDLAPILDPQAPALRHEGLMPVLVLERAQRQVGVLVDSISEIVSSREQKRLESRSEGLITHMVELEDRAVGVVSAERLLHSLRQRFADAARA